MIIRFYMFQFMAIVGGICLSKVFLEEDDSCEYTRFNNYILQLA